MGAWELYWITRLDGLNVLFGMGITFLVILFFVLFIWRSMLDIDLKYPGVDGYEKAKILIPFVNVGIIASPLLVMALSLALVLMPTTKEMALIYVAPKIINSELTGEIAADMKQIVSLATEKLKNMLEYEEAD